MCYRLGWVGCRTEVEPGLESTISVVRVEIHLILGVCSMYVDYLWCCFVKEGCQTLDFDEPLPGVFVSQSLPVCFQETQHPASFLLEPWDVVSE
jgi:hypothetical protein